MNTKQIMDSMYDSMAEEVNAYIKGEKCRSNRGGERYHIRILMMMVIENACGIHSNGIAVGRIDFAQYKKEVRRRKRYWDRVRAGETIDTRRGFDRERKGDER